MQLTSKGQVTVPKKFREKFGLHQGVEVDFIEEKGSLKLIKVSKGQTPLDRVYGILDQKQRSDDLIEKVRGR